MPRVRRLFYLYWEWLLVIPIFVWLFRMQNAYDVPPAKIGLMWTGALLSTVFIRRVAAGIRHSLTLRAARADRRQLTPGSSVPPVIYQMMIQANRISKVLRAEYPDDVERFLLVGGYDGRIDTLQALVILKGRVGEKLSAPFPGDPAGAWMLDDAGRETLSRIRAVIWSYAMAIGDAKFKPPVVFSNAQLTPLQGEAERG